MHTEMLSHLLLWKNTPPKFTLPLLAWGGMCIWILTDTTSPQRLDWLCPQQCMKWLFLPALPSEETHKWGFRDGCYLRDSREIQFNVNLLCVWGSIGLILPNIHTNTRNQELFPPFGRGRSSLREVRQHTQKYTRRHSNTGFQSLGSATRCRDMATFC